MNSTSFDLRYTLSFDTISRQKYAQIFFTDEEIEMSYHY